MSTAETRAAEGIGRNQGTIHLTAETLIPSVIHQVWIGGGPLTEEAARYHETWKKHHPHWDVVLWTKEKVERELIPLHNQAAYEADTNHGYRADILRVELLHRFGGLYADMDMECLRPHDALRTLPAFLGRGRLYDDREIGEQSIETSLMGSVPGHPFFARAARHLSAWAAAFEGYVVSARTGPQWLQRELYAYWKIQQGGQMQGREMPGRETRAGRAETPPERGGDLPDVLVLPEHYFYPRLWDHEPPGTGVTPETFCAHHWWGSWADRDWPSEDVRSLSQSRFRHRYLGFVGKLPESERGAFLAVLVETAARDLLHPNVFHQLEGAACLADLWDRHPQTRRMERRSVELALQHAAGSDNTYVRDAAAHVMDRESLKWLGQGESETGREIDETG